ncbi:MAG: hypothetical protein GWN01_02065 [Nitrosopumilaceae archaeon]|nr:hypothetical protein [Nitrosopumilaceae archaeon]NIT99759.1 hypothetical protein [Nitrosopumilaceae archaeon]NIU88621.1 hypothetical protein [Nitrosopumilaceae archaeon]NIV64895.1 hypothetical protein [Nitrosopumilaceae archaeon]NIX60362.1 hypothetical protein [Nitrosopumilaceae archaeon]
MDYPVSANQNGVNIKPENMKKEKLYHCIFENKLLLFFKDSQDILNCYEIEEKTLVDQVKSKSSEEDIERIFEEYIENENLKN